MQHISNDPTSKRMDEMKGGGSWLFWRSNEQVHGMIEGLIWSPRRLRITTRLMIGHLKFTNRI